MGYRAKRAWSFFSPYTPFGSLFTGYSSIKVDTFVLLFGQSTDPPNKSSIINPSIINQSSKNVVVVVVAVVAKVVIILMWYFHSGVNQSINQSVNRSIS